MPITTNVVSLNPAHGKVYSMQHYVLKFVSDLRQVCGFLWVLWFLLPIKLTTWYNWNIVESDIKHHNKSNHTLRVVFSTILSIYDKVCQCHLDVSSFLCILRFSTNKSDLHYEFFILSSSCRFNQNLAEMICR